MWLGVVVLVREYLPEGLKRDGDGREAAGAAVGAHACRYAGETMNTCANRGIDYESARASRSYRRSL